MWAKGAVATAIILAASTQAEAFARARATLIELGTGEQPVATLGDRLRAMLGART